MLIYTLSQHFHKSSFPMSVDDPTVPVILPSNFCVVVESRSFVKPCSRLMLLLACQTCLAYLYAVRSLMNRYWSSRRHPPRKVPIPGVMVDRFMMKPLVVAGVAVGFVGFIRGVDGGGGGGSFSDDLGVAMVRLSKELERRRVVTGYCQTVSWKDSKFLTIRSKMELQSRRDRVEIW